MNRIIAHIDMDAFFASIEQSKKPWLKGKAIAVAGNTVGRSVVATASYEARKFGVKSGMPLSSAKRLCPELILIKGSIDEYETISENLYHLFCEFSPAVEYFSIDEVFMDLSYVIKNYDEAICLEKVIKDEVLRKFGLTCSIGISYNKLMSKIAAKLCKPNGLMCIREDEALNILEKLPVGKITGIGKKTEILLKEIFHTETAGDLMKIPLLDLVKVFHSYGRFLYQACRGIDNSNIITFIDKENPKSVGNSVTLEKDTDNISEIKAVFKMLSTKVSSRLRGGGFEGRVIKITIRYEDFYTFTHEKEIPPTNLDSEIYSVAMNLFMEVYNGTKVRLLGISVSSLISKEQALLFLDSVKEKERKVLEAMDALRNRFGYDKLEYGSVNSIRKDFLLSEKKISGA